VRRARRWRACSRVVYKSVERCRAVTSRRVVRTSTRWSATFLAIHAAAAAAAAAERTGRRRDGGGAGGRCGCRRSATASWSGQRRRSAATRTPRTTASRTTAARRSTGPTTSTYSAPSDTSADYCGEMTAAVERKHRKTITLYSVARDCQKFRL